ncbi:MAG: PilZ domain-containing protein [Desulfomonilaceae bacterium]
MSPKQQISAREFIEDTRSGMTCSELAEKYKLSPNSIQRIFRGMIDGEIMTIDELAGRYALFDDTMQHGIDSVRLLFRQVVNFVLPIYEKETPKTLGTVLDITEGGFGLKGIEAITGEFKNFAIPANKFFDVARVEFRARCSWVNREESTGKCIGGFEITDISPGASVELRKLVQLIELANQVEVIECDEPSPEKTDRREEERYTGAFTLPVYEATKRHNKGIIINVSEGGIGVHGLSVKPGQRKTLVIQADYGFATFDSIVIVAECRWIETEGGQSERNSGFKVLQLTPKNALELAKLISTLSAY